MYGDPVWHPWVAATHLGRCQNRTHRVIACQIQATPVETLRQGVGICSIMNLMHRQTAITYEKEARLTSDHLRRRLLNPLVRHRPVRPSWRSAFQSLTKEMPNTLTSREPLPDQIVCPWASKGYWEEYPERVVPQQATTANINLQSNRETKTHVRIYTDGSVTGGTITGSAAMVVVTVVVAVVEAWRLELTRRPP